MRDRTAIDDIVQGAYNRALLDQILPHVRRAAQDCGYAVTVHGSLNRDIDIVAVPWVEHNVASRDELRTRVVGAIRGVTGRCYQRAGEWDAKPHGRFATTIIIFCGETSANLDLSVMPAIEKPKAAD